MRALVLISMLACSDPPPIPPMWSVEMQDLPAGLLSIWGANDTDIWEVGGDPGGDGPTVMHYDGTAWTPRDTGELGDLWWVFGFDGGPVYMGGSGGLMLRYQNGSFQKMTTPTSGTVFGIWGASPQDVWAVGGEGSGSAGGFAWKLDGDRWIEAPGLPEDVKAGGAVWKVCGRSATDVWLVGTNGLTVHWDGSAFRAQAPLVGESLFTCHCSGARCAAVGGAGMGYILENEGGDWTLATTPIHTLNGVYLTANGGVATGFDGAVYARSDTGWIEEDTGLDVFKTLHAVWIDQKGGYWAVGGDVASLPLINGVLVRRTPEVSDED